MNDPVQYSVHEYPNTPIFYFRAGYSFRGFERIKYEYGID